MTDVLKTFHPVVTGWFVEQFKRPSEVQSQAWPAIQSGTSTLIAAPTGSGKTLAAFLAVIDQLVKQGIEAPLPDETRILYVSPLKALSNDIHKNLEEPLTGIGIAMLEAALPDIVIRAQVRTGDTSQAERAAMKRFPPHILVTTPESLYLLLTSESGRDMLKSVRSVIVDEIHALAGNKRGAHLMLSLERLEQLTESPPIRIGLSATQKPLDGIAHYLLGNRAEPCTIIDTGHVRRRDLQIEVTGSPLEAVMAGEVWSEIYDRLEQLIAEHTTTLIFVNTRRQAERVAAALADRLGETAVTSHHGSLAKEHRLNAEQRLKQGQLKALVATASLELGIDIGDVDLVCQLGSPHSISAFLQRVGRSGHRLGATPKGRLFPLSRDDLLECGALLYAVGQDLLDTILIPTHPLDVLAQQIVAEVACREWCETELYRAFCKAWPYRALTEAQFSAVIKMLAEGFHTRRGRRGAYLHRDAVHGMLRPRKGARLTALLNGGAIPDLFDYDVILQPEGLFVGTLNEDFAFESLPGDIFQLGNNSYRLVKVEQGKVYVEDAHGQPPNIPFWFGEAPGRSVELSEAVSSLSEHIDSLLELGGENAAYRYLIDLALPHAAAEQLARYLAAAKAALTVLPTLNTIVFERFFDETQDMHFVIHSPYGSRVNRAWGLALRKRFCRKFNFELQAAASEDNIVLSLGPTHSFPLAEPAGYLKAATVEGILIQALLAAPMFPTRWRWVANTALAVPRNRSGKRVPAQFQRNNAEDLIAVIFPDQLACFENIAGDREIPDHPLVNQALWDCLHELMDIDGLIGLLDGIETGRVRIVARDLSAPSPMAQEILNARPYAFLDDAPAEERRTLAIQQRRFSSPEEAAEIGRLDPAAIVRVRQEAWPEANSADELHDALLVLGFLRERECEGVREALFEELQQAGRAAQLCLPDGQRIRVAAERLHELQVLFPGVAAEPQVAAVDFDPDLTAEKALQDLIRSRLEGLGPVTPADLADSIALPIADVEQALAALEQQGFAIQGRFNSDAAATEWCERGLLARIHRYTLKQLRSEVQPVSAADYMRFLFRWHGFDEAREGEAALEKVLLQLEGCNISAALWESEILPRRLKPYFASQLDQCCGSGRFIWLRLKFAAAAKSGKFRKPAGKTTSIALIGRTHLPYWRTYAPLPEVDKNELSGSAQKVYAVLKGWGASFFQELAGETGLLNAQLIDALGELVAAGLITSDTFQGLRALIQTAAVRQRRSRRYPAYEASDTAGRWSLLRPVQKAGGDSFEPVEHIARVLLNRYGVVFRKLLDNEEGVPTWRELLYVYRRLEARGELRGGRFVQGAAGEHFALPQAVSLLRDIRGKEASGELVAISTVDPLNLTGIVGGDRIGPQTAGRILYRDGVPMAWAKKNHVVFLRTVEPELEWQYKTALLRK